MRRLFISGDSIKDGGIYIKNRDDIYYLSVVLRMKDGDCLFVSDGAGRAYTSRIVKAGKDVIELEILAEQTAEDIVKTQITLYQGLPKGSKMDDVVRKTTELGVFRIVPILTARSVPALKGGEALSKVERWRRIAKEAARQSGRFGIPEVAGITRFEEAAAGLQEYDMVLALYELEEGLTLKQALRDKACSLNKESSDQRKLVPVHDNQPGDSVCSAPLHIAVFIGPEGGFEPGEIELLLGRGAKSVTVGDTILRTETAGMAAIAMVRYELEL